VALEVVVSLLALVLALAAIAGAVALFRTVREELRLSRDESRSAAVELRGEVAKRFDANSSALSTILQGVTRQIKELQEGNEKKLDEMRHVVDEKLQGALERRLGESFKLVSDRLEAVQRGLGEMQSLAVGVGDLKRVLTNVKTRGVFGEVQLGAILEQVLTPDQYGRNVRPRPDSRETVEFAVRLPGSDASRHEHIWLPIDSKFPQEDYGRLLSAVEAADADAVASASAGLARAIRLSAQEIRQKYVCPPHTTDFAILFVPTEGLYAELLRQAGLVESLQQDQRIVVAGPTTLAALLNTLRIGFRTLAIERRASEVWQVLAAVKGEFAKFGDVLDRVKKQLQTASNTIEETGVRTRAITRQLREVEELPTGQGALEFDDSAKP
jgi:DNA recombination protein RmuC